MNDTRDKLTPSKLFVNEDETKWKDSGNPTDAEAKKKQEKAKHSRLTLPIVQASVNS